MEFEEALKAENGIDGHVIIVNWWRPIFLGCFQQTFDAQIPQADRLSCRFSLIRHHDILFVDLVAVNYCYPGAASGQHCPPKDGGLDSLVTTSKLICLMLK